MTNRMLQRLARLWPRSSRENPPPPAPTPVVTSAPVPVVYAWSALTSAKIPMKTSLLNCSRLLFTAPSPLKPGALLDLEILLSSVRVRLQGRVKTSESADVGYAGEVTLMADAETRALLTRRLPPDQAA